MYNWLNVNKIISILLVFVLVLTFTACSGMGDLNGSYCSSNPEGDIVSQPYFEDVVSECEHSYIPATCTDPQKCSLCGETFGSPTEHNWNEATCITAKKCDLCSVTDGEALGHQWKEATCIAPMICAVCQATSGATLGHKYSGGKCSVCYAKDPGYQSVAMVWIPTNGGKKYHSNSGCSNMIDPIQVTKSEAEGQGFTPCKRCY